MEVSRRRALRQYILPASPAELTGWLDVQKLKWELRELIDDEKRIVNVRLDIVVQ